MNVGTLCYDTAQGLGYLAKSFVDAGVVTHPYVVEHPVYNGQGWYPDAPRSRRTRLDFAGIRRFLDTVDVMLFFETPFEWNLLHSCRAAKVRTVLMPMYECMPRVLPVKPDRIINPSLLDQRYYPKGEFIPVPVERPWRLRERAKTFIFNAGHGGLRGRNGTAEVVSALKHVQSAATILIRSQEFNEEIAQAVGEQSSRIDVHYSSGTAPYATLYDAGDVFLFPEKFNGLSLPLQEAYASGMLVMASSRFPNTTYLPTDPLIPIEGTTRKNVSARCNDFDEAIISPVAIAEMIDSWYDRDIRAYSESGRAYGERNSWAALKDRYLKALS